MVGGQSLKRRISRNPVVWPVLARYIVCKLYRSYFGGRVSMMYPLLKETRETSNFTYELTETSLMYLADTIAAVTKTPRTTIEGYLREAREDRQLLEHFNTSIQAHGWLPINSVPCPFGRRLGWYAVARAVKPRIIVETGVDRGHGALLLCAALRRNGEEGHPGRYYGTDINPSAGWLLSGHYAEVGKVLYGDSLESLSKLNDEIDLFINDSDHSAEYEAREYALVAPKLSGRAILLGDNSHVTDKLALFARATDRQFLFFREQPKDHWYPGAGIGFAFR
jgi:hypothetical protein